VFLDPLEQGALVPLEVLDPGLRAGEPSGEIAAQFVLARGLLQIPCAVARRGEIRGEPGAGLELALAALAVAALQVPLGRQGAELGLEGAELGLTFLEPVDARVQVALLRAPVNRPRRQHGVLAVAVD
jgi:hypothetical protein